MNSQGACQMRTVFISPAVSGRVQGVLGVVGAGGNICLFIVFLKAMRKNNMKTNTSL